MRWGWAKGRLVSDCRIRRCAENDTSLEMYRIRHRSLERLTQYLRHLRDDVGDVSLGERRLG